MVKIFIDPGHGGKDPGAVGNGLQEKDLTLKISLKIRDILQKEYSNVDVRLSRTTDVYLSLAERVRLTNAWGADLLLSIHINATPSGYGYEDYIYNGPVSTVSVKVQNAINEEVVKATGWRNRGKKRKNLQVLRDSKMAALLTESGFIDNPGDGRVLKDDAFLNKIARGHANGIANAFNLSRKSKASNGWVKSGANWTFYQNSKLKTGWLQDKKMVLFQCFKHHANRMASGKRQVVLLILIRQNGNRSKIYCWSRWSHAISKSKRATQ